MDYFLFTKNVLVVLVIMLLIDGVYLSLTGATFIKMLVAVQKSEVRVRWIGAAICYIFMALLFYLFAIRKNSNYIETFLLGSLSYGIYDSVNYALLSGWDGFLAIQDTLWGGTLFVITKIAYDYLSI